MNKNEKPDYVFAFNQIIRTHLDTSLCSSEMEDCEPQLAKMAAKSILKSLMVECDVNDFSSIERCINKKLNEVNEAYINNSNYSSKIDSISTILSVAKEELKNFDICSFLLRFCANNYLPITLLYKISSIVSFENVFCRWKISNNLRQLKNDLTNTILQDGSDSEKRRAVGMVLSSLVFFRYQLPNKYSSMKDSSQDVLVHLARSIVETCMEAPLTVSNNDDIMDFYNILTEDETLPKDRLLLFIEDQLKLILTQKTDILLSAAIQNQSQWSSVCSNKHLITMFFTIISFLGYSQVLEIFDCAVTTSEVYWGTILTLLGCLLTFSQEASTKVRALITKYLVEGCNNQDSEYVILGFLFARHASQEGRHVFPSYTQWFASSFGSESSSPANSKAAFIFLVDFLKELVPFEKRETLYAHVSQSIYIPNGCRDILRDYKNLAKARIQELDDELGKNVPVEVEVAQTIAEYVKTGRIPSALNETAIFHRAKFLNSFVPALLTPRELPAVPDARMEFITALVWNSKKIPLNVYDKYLEKCRLVAQGRFTESTDAVRKPEDILSLIDSILNLTSSKENSALALFSKISYFMEPVRFPVQSDKKTALTHDVALRIISIIGSIYCDETMSNLSEKHVIIMQLLSITASNEAVQLYIIDDLCDIKSTNSADELVKKGVIMAEVASLNGSFPSVEESGDVYRPTEMFFRKLFNTDSILCSCSLISSWVDWAFSNELFTPDKIASLYCCLAARVAFVEESNLISTEDSDNYQANVPFPVFRNGNIAPCCVFFWKHFATLKKPSIQEWVQFELYHNWNGAKWSSSLLFVEFWLSKFFFEKINHIDAFNEYFSSLVLNMDQGENFSLLVLALQNLANKLDSNPAIFETFLQLSSSDHSDNQLLVPFISLAMCLPRNKFFSRSSVKKCTAFTCLIHSVLDLKSELFLDVRNTSFFLEIIISAAKENSIADVSPLINPVLESVMFHLQSLSNIMEREKIIIDKIPYLQSIRNMMFASQECVGLRGLISVLANFGYPNVDFRIYHYVTSYLGHLIMQEKVSFALYNDNSIMDQYKQDIDKVLIRLERSFSLSDYLAPDWCSALARTYRQKVLYLGTIYVIMCHIRNKISAERFSTSESFSARVLFMLNAYQELCSVSEEFTNSSLLLLEIRIGIVNLINNLPSLHFDKWQYQSIMSCDSDIIAAVDKNIGLMDTS